MIKTFSYKDTGVDIKLGDDASKVLYNAARQTWGNREGRLGELIVPFDDFTGVRAIDVSGLPEGTLMNIGFDGVGTKIELAERVGNHRTIGYDLLAMICDDAVVRGAEPVLVGSTLDVNSLGKGDETYIDQVKQLAEGYIAAAKAANVAIVNGEVAELGSRVGGYGPFKYNWSASVVWFAKKDRLFTGKEIKEGDYLVGLQETGFRSNGLSLVRKIMTKTHGDNWHSIPWKVGGGGGITKFGDLALAPSRIYSKAVVDMFGGYDKKPKVEVHGVAHITGGGLPAKLGRVLKPSGLGADVHSPFRPSRFMLYIQRLGNVPDREAYKTWNMGQGMVIIAPDDVAVQQIAREHGIPSQTIGKVVKKPGIRIQNMGDNGKESELYFKQD